MRKHLYINDIDICDFGIYISSDTYLNSPLIDYQEYKIPSRDGNVIQYNKRFNNVIRRFDCYVHDTHDIKSALASLKKLLYNNIGYVKLVSDYDQGYYQYGYLAQELNVEPFRYNNVVTFELYFSCMPKKYISSDFEYDFINSLGATKYAQNVYLPSDDDFVKDWTSRASNTYPTSYLGWILCNEKTTNNVLALDKDYVIDVSSDIKEYMVFAISYYPNETTMDKDNATKYELIGEVDNYNATINYHSDNDTRFVQKIGFMFPITKQGTIIGSGGDYDTISGLTDSMFAIIRCTATQLNSSTTHDFDIYIPYWSKYSNKYLNSDLAFGNNIVINGLVSFYEDYKTNIYDHFMIIGDCQIIIKYVDLINDYGFDNFVDSYCTTANACEFELDVVNKTLRVFNDGELVLDISNYLEVYGNVSDDTNLAVYSSEPSLNTNQEGIVSLIYPTYIRANWWAV